jgi:transposase
MGRLRAKIPDLVRALDGRFDTHHAVHLRQLLDHIDWFEATITTLDERVAELTKPWGDLLDRLQTIPGVGRRTAEVIVAETGGDMTLWPSAGHLASWAGMSPGHNESGGKRRSGRTTTGDVWLADALTEAAWSAVRAKDTYLAAKFWRVAGPRATANRKKKAAIAVGHKILIAAYHIAATPDEVYRDLGGDYFARRDDPDRRRNRLLAQLASLGYQVELTPTT